ncbi:MAG: AmmeMemoRadiSam system protein A [Halanaerobiales bacterium]
MSDNGNVFVNLARKTIESFVKQERLQIPEPLPEELNREAGVFVSIKKNGQLRGCIGTIQPTQDNLAEEIISNAISAASRDPRFPAIEEHELPELDISVDILEEPEPIDSVDKLDPWKYGIIVEKGFHRGLLLPMLEGIDTVEEQLDIAVRKAGLSPDEDLENLQLYRFRVTRYK